MFVLLTIIFPILSIVTGTKWAFSKYFNRKKLSSCSLSEPSIFPHPHNVNKTLV